MLRTTFLVFNVLNQKRMQQACFIDITLVLINPVLNIIKTCNVNLIYLTKLLNLFYHSNVKYGHFPKTQL